MVNVVTLNLSEILLSAQQALQLLSAYPFHWLGLILLFLVCVESLMFIPRVGFTLKAAVAGVMGAQMFVLFHEASRGQAPQWETLFLGFTLPPASLGLLIAATWLPIAVGYAAIWQMEGWKSVRFFFGNIRKDEPPSKAAFLRFKLVALVFGSLFTFLPPALVLTNLPPIEALSVALKAAFFEYTVDSSVSGVHNGIRIPDGFPGSIRAGWRCVFNFASIPFFGAQFGIFLRHCLSHFGLAAALVGAVKKGHFFGFIYLTTASL